MSYEYSEVNNLGSGPIVRGFSNSTIDEEIEYSSFITGPDGTSSTMSFNDIASLIVGEKRRRTDSEEFDDDMEDFEDQTQDNTSYHSIIQVWDREISKEELARKLFQDLYPPMNGDLVWELNREWFDTPPTNSERIFFTPFTLRAFVRNQRNRIADEGEMTAAYAMCQEIHEGKMTATGYKERGGSDIKVWERVEKWKEKKHYVFVDPFLAIRLIEYRAPMISGKTYEQQHMRGYDDDGKRQRTGAVVMETVQFEGQNVPVRSFFDARKPNDSDQQDRRPRTGDYIMMYARGGFDDDYVLSGDKGRTPDKVTPVEFDFEAVLVCHSVYDTKRKVRQTDPRPGMCLGTVYTLSENRHDCVFVGGELKEKDHRNYLGSGNYIPMNIKI